jgi:hypothetical protein
MLGHRRERWTEVSTRQRNTKPKPTNATSAARGGARVARSPSRDYGLGNERCVRILQGEHYYVLVLIKS